MNYYKIPLASLLFSLFIYLEYFNLSSKILVLVISLSAYLIIFTLNKRELFVSGTIIGILWFWWIGYSFIYYELNYLIPLVIIIIGMLYGLFFLILGYIPNIYLKALYLFALSFFEPFGFNWFKPELLFINSYLGTSKIEFFIILLVSAYFMKNYRSNKYSYLIYGITIISLIIYNLNSNPLIKPLDLKIIQHNTSIDQEIKWKKNFKQKIIEENFNVIERAIKDKYDLIILPETSFPLVLNKNKQIMSKLLNYSREITILTGSLHYENNLLHNSSYLFQDSTYKIAHKVVLVPFGEAVPFPEKIRNWINNTFYNGAQDYEVAQNPTTFTIKGQKFRNAICYEATTDEIFKDLDTNYVIAISNNAWFVPSHQPVLQKLLMKYFENKYKVKIISVTNQ